MRTKEKLALVCEQEGFPDLAARARRAEFDDFESNSATPNIDLYNEFIRRGRKDLAKRVVDGEWDSTPDESEAWAKSEDGRATFAALLGEKPPPVGASGLGVTREQRAKIEELVQEFARDVQERAKELRHAVPGVELLFATMLFTAGPGGFSTYVSNAAREDMIKALREQADGLERRMHSAPLRSQQ